MVQSQFCLSWDDYKSNVCGGFSSLQQNGEFVDMTLAADGHFVKVHQVLVAMVSPYLKELITSAPCQHPVIFLNNVSYKILCYLLEYVYTGEVLVQSEHLMTFIETAKALHIKGLEGITNNTPNVSYNVVDNLPQLNENIPGHMTGMKTLTLPDANTPQQQIKLPAGASRVLIKRHEYTDTPSKQSKKQTNISSIESLNNDSNVDYMEVMDSSGAMNVYSDDDDDDTLDTKGQLNDQIIKFGKNISDDKHGQASTSLQFTVSIRGSLQVILNRYIYNLHSTTHRTGVRRWRCVEYRNHRCKAFIVTKGNVVLNRANLHNHSFHDKKILQKIEKKAVFSALDQVEDYKREFEKISEAEQKGFEIFTTTGTDLEPKL